MSAKAVLVFCAQAVFVQSVLSQCTSRAAIAADPALMAPAGPYGLAAPGFTAPYGRVAPAMAASYELAASCPWAAPAMDITPTSGGIFPVSSSSATPPVGLSVVSENVYDGILAAVGELPFVGTVAVEGVLPTAGAGAINHECGNGINAMVSETTAFVPEYTAAMAPAAISPSFAAPALGYRADWAGRGCGYAL